MGSNAKEQKLLVIIGITGNQGGSVATAFLSDPNYRIRGITRNPSSPKAKQWEGKGVEIVEADLDDVKSLEKAFEGANLIFSVTDYWEPFFMQRDVAEKEGYSYREWAGRVEYRELSLQLIFIFE